MFSRIARRCAVRRTPRRVAARMMSTVPDAVGFIGLGNMGSHMAHNLIKAGRRVVAFDVVPASLERAESQGATVASSPKDVAAVAGTIITMLPSSKHVRHVYEDPTTGIFAALHPGSLLVDSSTIEPLIAAEMATKAEGHGAIMVDAPVSGGVGGAEAGTLTFMVGGTDSAYQQAQNVLSLMGKNIVHCGGNGTGQTAKICNNLVLAVSMVGVSEGMSLGSKLGMDPKVLAGIFNTSTARCWSSDTYNPCPGVMEGVPSSRGYTGGFGVDLMKKDLGLAMSSAAAAGAQVPVAALVSQLYGLLSAHGKGGQDFSSVFEWLHTQNNRTQ